MEKYLFHEEPMITSFPSTALIMMMFQENLEQYKPWLANHFLKLVGMDRSLENNYAAHEVNFFDGQAAISPIFTEYEPVLVYKLPRSIIQHKWLYFHKFVRDCINSKFYIHICLNNAYLECSNLYQVKNYQHPTTIYGYDDDRVYLADFYGKKFSLTSVENNSADLAFLSYYDESKKPSTDYLRDIYLLKLRDNEYEFRLDYLVEDLNDHLNSRDSTNKYSRSYLLGDSHPSFGLACYDVICNNMETNAPDIRSFHLLYDHKVMMKFRIEYLIEKTYLSESDVPAIMDSCDAIIKNSLALRNLVLKLQMKGTINESKDEIKSKLMELKNEDSELSKILLDCISKYKAQ